MKAKIFSLGSLLLAAGVVLPCARIEAQAPVISSFSPSSGSVGTSVTLNGTNFSTNLSDNIVLFGSARASVVSATTDSLTVTAPAGATYAPLSVEVGGLTGVAALPFDFTFSAGGFDATSFEINPLQNTGNMPGGVAIADIDGDGKPDVIIANFADGTISVYRNVSTNGSLIASSFAPRVDFQVEANPYYISVGDLDGDGKPDIAAASSSGVVSVLKNISSPGNVAMQPKVNFPIAGNSVHVGMADLNGDGKLDLVAVYTSGSAISILRNVCKAGTIAADSFAPAIDVPVASGPWRVAFADFDGDGKTDIAVACDGGGCVSILRNLTTDPANITFASHVDFSVGSRPLCVAAGDLDGDGKPDVVVSTYGSGTLSVFRNIAQPGSFSTNSLAPKFDLSVGGSTHTVVFADLNGDGKPDLAAVGEYANTMAVFINQSSVGVLKADSFLPRVDFSTPNNPNGIAIGDLDGDGKPDVVIPGNYTTVANVYRNTPVTDEPRILIQPRSTNALVGHTAILDVTASGLNPLGYQWYFQGDALAGATNASLILTNVQTLASGNYFVVVTNSLSSITSQVATLTVALPPGITSQPQGQSVVAGGSVTLNVQASGTGPLSYQWLFSGAAIKGATNDSFTVANVQPTNAGNYQVVVRSPYGSIVSSNALVSVTSAVFQIPNLSSLAASTVVVPVNLVSLGGENAGDFSVRFDPAVLTVAGIDIGDAMNDAYYIINTNEVASGKLGLDFISQPGSGFAAGTQEVLRISFKIAPLSSPVVTPITFQSSPVAIDLYNATGEELAVTTANGSVSVLQTEYEADMDGNHLVVTHDWLQIGRYVAGLDPVPNSDAFQRADCAPVATRGDGKLTLIDWIQAGLYVKDFKSLTPLGGPTGEVPTPASRVKSALGTATAVTLVPVAGMSNTFDVQIAAQGNENGLAFTLNYDPTILRFVKTDTLVSGANVVVNTNVSGKIGMVLALQSWACLKPGVQSLVRIQFAPVQYVAKTANIGFSSSLVAMELADASAKSLPVSCSDLSITADSLVPPALTIVNTANSVIVSWPTNASGFVLESSTGLGSGWNPVSVAPTTNGDVLTVTLPPGNGLEFYRLKLPKP